MPPQAAHVYVKSPTYPLGAGLGKGGVRQLDIEDAEDKNLGSGSANQNFQYHPALPQPPNPLLGISWAACSLEITFGTVAGRIQE